jgi:hypothetical protein
MSQVVSTTYRAKAAALSVDIVIQSVLSDSDFQKVEPKMRFCPKNPNNKR